MILFFKHSALGRAPKSFWLFLAVVCTLVACKQDEAAPKQDSETPKNIVRYDPGARTINDEFVANWENETSVRVSNPTSGTIIPVNLPWAPSYGSTLPDDIRTDIKKVDGWRMGFCLFNQSGQEFNYFSLYNIYTGIMRVFYYQPTVAAEGGEISFLVTPNNYSTTKYPYYHAWQYGIPINHDVHGKNNLFGVTTNSRETFQYLTVPYTTQPLAVLATGWTAFDIDMSCYNPAATFDQADGLMFTGQTQKTSAVSLYGTIQAGITGNFSYAPPSTPSVSSSGGFWTNLVGSGAMTVFKDIASENYFNALIDGITAGVNMAGKMKKSDVSKPAATGQGKISLDLTGQLSIGGYMSSSTSNDVANAGLVFKGLLKDEHVGKGIWSLSTDPVIYIVNDLVVGEPAFGEELAARGVTNWIFFNPTPPGNLGGKDVQQTKDEVAIDAIMWNGSMVPFLDPATIQLNLSTDQYSGIRDINVSWSYGVYPNAPMGHTNNYREFLELPKVGSPQPGTDWWDKLTVSMKKNDQPITPPYNWEANDYIVKNFLPISAADLISPAITDQGEYKFYEQRGTGDFTCTYYGTSTTADDNIDLFIADPQVLLPSSDAYRVWGFNLYPHIVPDFVVWVMVSFKYDDDGGNEQIGVFSKRFLPDIKVLSIDELKAKKPAISRVYINKSKNGEEIQKVGNLSVTHKDGYIQMHKISKVLEKLEE